MKTNKPSILLTLFSLTQANAKPPKNTQILEDLNEIITDISNNYIYIKNKSVDLACIKA